MHKIWKMTWVQVKLSYRIKIAFFFMFIMPMAFFFIYAGLFARGNPNAVAQVMGPLVSLSVISSGLMGLGMQIVMMRERDMLRRYHLAPITALDVIVSRLIANYLLYLPVVVFQFALAIWMFHMPLQGSLFGLWLVFSLGFLSLGGLGLIVAGVINTMQEAQAVNNILFFAMLFLTGSTVPLSQLPHYLQKLSLFLPPTLMVIASQMMMLGNQGVAQHWPEIIGLVLSFIASLGLAAPLFRWEKEEKVSRRNRLKALWALAPLLVVGIWLNLSSGFQRTNRPLFHPSAQTAAAAKAAANSAARHLLPPHGR